MTPHELLDAFTKTADDARISRSERDALRQVLSETSRSRRIALRAQLFELAADRLHDPRDRALLGWLEDCVKLLAAPDRDDSSTEPARAYFGPEDPMVERLESLVRNARRSVDLAVFTLTDDRLSRALLDAHRRGVRVRVLSDDDKAHDLGSDALTLSGQGVPVRFDRSPHHFHHKFALFDGDILATGSYNWTRGADRNNRENFAVIYDAGLIRQFARAFDRLWEELG